MTTFRSLKPLDFPWSVEYSPYTSCEGREIPAYRVLDASGQTVCETNENGPDNIQEACADLIAAAPALFEALEYFFNIMHDYESSRQKGYVKAALDMARVALGRIHAPKTSP